MDTKKIQILLIEDNPGDVRLIREMLKDAAPLHCSLVHFGNFSEGLASLTKNIYDIILLDIGLPDSSELDSISEIKKASPATPIIMLTGLDDEQSAISSLHLGAQDYLVKGQTDSNLLARSIRYAIERNQIEKELKRHREELMILVEEQTAELQKSNMALLLEIAERKKINELLENVFSNVHVLIAYMDTDFNFIKVNKKYAESDGREPAFFHGKNHFSLYPNKENEAIFRRVVETGTPYFVRSKPFRYPEHPERETSFWDWSLKPVKDADGKVSGLVLSLIDVTENITLYSELMRSEHLASVGKLAAGVAHEVNNPINGIINYAEILLGRCDPGSKEHDIAQRILKESDRISGIASGLLSFARGSCEEKKAVHISEILSDSLSLAKAQMEKSGIKIALWLPPDLPPVVAQYQHIEQVFLNLINNACYALNKKYPGDHKDKLLDIRAEPAKVDKKPFMRITFHDHGIGISDGIKNRVMDPFFTTKHGSEGTGLGLSISHGIISDHGGKITIESSEGKFTKVIIDLPLKV